MNPFAAALAVIFVTSCVLVIISSTRKAQANGDQIRVKELMVYPVKSAAGVAVSKVQLDSQCGIAFDRLWTVVDGRGVFMSQRRASKLALVQPSLPSSFSEPLSLSAPGMPTIQVPQIDAADKRVVRIWEDRVEAVDQGDEVAAWLVKFLEVPGLRLVRMPKSTSRWCDVKYAPFLGSRAAFSDGFPILLASTASLDDLNAKLRTPIPMNRFRPNVIIEGPSLKAWREDSWLYSKIQIGGARFLVAKPCGRCKMPTIDQRTGVVGGDPSGKADGEQDDDLGGGPKPGAEPSATLATFRTGKDLGYDDPSWKCEVFFGQNLCIASSLFGKLGLTALGTIAVGDTVLTP